MHEATVEYMGCTTYMYSQISKVMYIVNCIMNVFCGSTLIVLQKETIKLQGSYLNLNLLL